MKSGMSTPIIYAGQVESGMGPKVQPASDADLILAISKNQDASAFAQLYERYKNSGYALAYRITRQKDMAEEALQEAMLRIWNAARSFDPKGNPKGWILKIVAREGLEAMKKNRRRQVIKEREGAREHLAADEHSDSAAEHGEALAMLHGLLDRLPDIERQMVALYYAAGFSQAEIAEQLAVPQRTVSFRLSKVLEGLRQGLSKAGFAAALPLLEADSLGNAMLSGTPAPASIATQIFENLAEQVPVGAQGPAVAAGSKLSWAVVGAGIVILATGAGLWTKAKVNSEAQTVPPHKKSDKILPASPPLASEKVAPNLPDKGKDTLKYRDLAWSFDTGLPKGPVLLEGGWKFEPHPNKAANVLWAPPSASYQPALLALPVHARGTPYLVTLKEIYLRDCISTKTLAFSDGRAVLEGRIWIRPRIFLKFKKARGHGSTIRYWHYDRYLVGTEKGQVTYIEHLPEEKSTFTRLILACQDVAIESISFREIRREEIPAELRDPKALIATFEAEGIKSTESKVLPLLDRHTSLLAKPFITED